MSLVARAVVLGLALFALTNLAVSALVALLARRAELGGRGADGLFLLRMLPSLAAVGVGIGLWVPSYWLLEPRQAEEAPAWVAQWLAALGAALILAGAYRGLRAQAATARLTRSQGAATPLATEALPAYRLPTAQPTVVLVGLVKPRVLLSSRVLEVLTAPELAVVLAHEDAHRRARDNWRRLAMAAAPDALGWLGGARPLEVAWRRAAETRADHRAVEGQPERAINLCNALIKVARLGLAAPVTATFGSFLHDGEELRDRIERLLGEPLRAAPRRVPAWPWLGLALFVVPGLHLVHECGELLLRLGR